MKESYTKPHVVSSTQPCPGALGSPLPCLQQRWEQPSPPPGTAGCPQTIGGGGLEQGVPLQGVPNPWGVGAGCPQGQGVSPGPWGCVGAGCPHAGRRILYRTEYRQAVRTDYRQRYECCLGYYESRDACVRE